MLSLLTETTKFKLLLNLNRCSNSSVTAGKPVVLIADVVNCELIYWYVVPDG